MQDRPVTTMGRDIPVEIMKRDMDADIMMQRKITVADAVPMKEQRAEKAVDAAVENAARANVGKTLKVHYTGTFNDGTKFDSSYDRGEPLEFVCGAGMMIKGFDRAVADMEIGQIKDIHLMPEEAYGLPDPNAIFHVEISQLPGAEELEEGQQVYLQNEMGQPFPVTVVAKEAGIITFDANHEMAGKELNFKIELVEIC